MYKKTIAFALAVFLTIAGFLPLRAFADELFDTEFNVTYNIASSGEADITQNIKITNKQNDVVATNYSLTIKDMNIYDAGGTDDEGELKLETITLDNTTTLKTEFNEQVIGADRSYEWQLRYKSRDIATKVGEIWNVHIPKVEVLDLTKGYNVTLIIPKEFGPEIFLSPLPAKITEDGTTTTYFFDKDALAERGITASFGNFQVLNFQLKYNLAGDSVFTSYKEIALPPDIPYTQQILYKSLEPQPYSVHTDNDGNLIATYKISGGEEVEVVLTGSARITGKQINPEFGGSLDEIPADLKRMYTNAEKYWEVDSPTVRQIAESLKDEGLTTSQNAQRVYDYVTQNLNYDFDIINKDFVDRRGALNALTNPGPWACMEFTDSFIAISRAMGIPARELNGYAFVRESNLTPLSISLKSGDLLHSWTEFYDPNFGWVQIDPTWGNTSGIDYFTKLDTNHVVFSIKGLSSEYPFPAGAYKITGNEKQVEVDVAQNPQEIIFTENIKVYEKENPGLILKFVTSFRKTEAYVVYNQSGIKLYNLNRTDQILQPFSTAIVQLPKGSRDLYFEDFNGKAKILNFAVTSGEPPQTQSSNSSLFVVAGAALLLCTIIYWLAIHPEALKKVSHRLPHHPQAQGQ